MITYFDSTDNTGPSMPHDVFNQPLKVGDLVTIEFEITAINEGEEYCNCQLRSVEPMPPYTTEFINLYAVNTHQTKLMRSLAELNDDFQANILEEQL